MELDQPLDHTIWLGSTLSIETGYSGLTLPRETVVLHFLPLVSQIIGKNDPMRTPLVHPVLSRCQRDKLVQSPLFGCLYQILLDTHGSWELLFVERVLC